MDSNALMWLLYIASTRYLENWGTLSKIVPHIVLKIKA